MNCVYYGVLRITYCECGWEEKGGKEEIVVSLRMAEGMGRVCEKDFKEILAALNAV